MQAFLVSVSEPFGPDTVRLTEYVPGKPYVTEWGPCVLAVPGVASAPKSHDHEVTEPAEASLKVTVRGAVPDVGVALKSAIMRATVMKSDCTLLFEPAGPVTALLPSVKTVFSHS